LATRTVRSFSIDHDVSRAFDREAERLGDRKASELANQLFTEALMVREAMRLRQRGAEGATYAGLGAAALTALLTLVVLLG
jgi:hypothetical protein